MISYSVGKYEFYQIYPSVPHRYYIAQNNKPVYFEYIHFGC